MSPVVVPAAVTLRPAGYEDAAFLRGLYASTREQELAVTDWSTEQKAAFLTQQFEAQQHHYRTNYADASFDVVVEDGEPIGRLYVARWEHEIRVVDVALIPAARGRGVGGALLRALLAEGARSARTVTIHVEQFNPARRLYHRLGFREVEPRGPYVLMEWRPPDQVNTAS